MSEMKKVLVTGSEGYIGSVMMPMLQQAGFDVTGLDAGWFADGQLTPFERTWPLVCKDIRDIQQQDLEGVWAIIHLAAISNDPMGELDPQITLDINYHATVRLAEIAKQAGVQRFVYSSSCSMYGVASEGFVDESAEFNPQTAYAESKVRAETELRQLADEQFSPVYLRNATAFGISPRQRFDLVLPSLAGYAQTTGKIHMLSDGSPWRPLVHIRDISKAAICCLTADREAIHNEAFNIGSNSENYQVRQIAEAVQQEYPDCELTFGPPPAQADTRSYRVDFTKVHRDLPGFQTEWTIADGARECGKVFRSISLSTEDFQNRYYTRLHQLRHLLSEGAIDSQLRWTSQNPPEQDPLAFVCRSCGSDQWERILDLGTTPLANRLLTEADLDQPELRFPLDTVFCKQCSLLQITETVDPEVLFRNYLYFSSFSDALLRHAAAMAEAIMAEKDLGSEHLVVEAASNDGYLLQYFQQHGVQVLGVEPASNIAKVATDKGIPTANEFFGREFAEKFVAGGQQADVFLGNNVLAHVADLNGFVASIKTILKPDGMSSIEVPYARDLIEHCEFDTIYHEHLCYYSLTALDQLFSRHGLTIFDVSHVPIHGGSLRFWAGHSDHVERRESETEMLRTEAELGMTDLPFYRNFADRVEALKTELCGLVRRLRQEGSRIAAYGASAKGSTLLNYFGIDHRDIEFVADRSTVKQGHYTPGTRIPIVDPEAILREQPDYVLLLTWNFRDEILAQQQTYLQAGGRFIVPVPRLEIVETKSQTKIGQSTP